MTDTAPVINPGLIARVQNILLNPAQEWEVIKTEPSSVQSLFTGYAMILAAIPAVAMLLSRLLWGGFDALILGLVGAVLQYVLGLGVIFVTGIVIEQLADKFGAQRDQIASQKVAVYSATPSWIGGVLYLIPGQTGQTLAALVGLYGIYLIYLGLKQVVGAPQDKAIAYTAVVIVSLVVLMLIVVAIIGAVLEVGS